MWYEYRDFLIASNVNEMFALNHNTQPKYGIWVHPRFKDVLANQFRGVPFVP